MEDVDGGDGNAARPPRQNRRDPKLKYMEVLQGVADRAVSEVLIDLDDLESVRRPNEAFSSLARSSGLD
jgi:hypothetical protein